MLLVGREFPPCAARPRLEFASPLTAFPWKGTFPGARPYMVEAHERHHLDRARRERRTHRPPAVLARASGKNQNRRRTPLEPARALLDGPQRRRHAGTVDRALRGRRGGAFPGPLRAGPPGAGPDCRKNQAGGPLPPFQPEHRKALCGLGGALPSGESGR